jgi:hypothetical protein
VAQCGRILPTMDPKSAAEELPALYRALLDRVAQLEAAGQRDVGFRIRSKATRIYSRAWDDRARRMLQALLHQTIDRQPLLRGQVHGSRRRSEPVI